MSIENGSAVIRNSNVNYNNAFVSSLHKVSFSEDLIALKVR